MTVWARANSPSGDAQKIENVLGRQRLQHGLRIGEANILNRHAHKPPGDEQTILASIKHAREPIERGVRDRTRARPYAGR